MSAHPNRTVAFACSAMLVSYLPFSAVNGALGAVAAATGAGTLRLQWVSDAFAVALAAVVLPAGVLAGRIGNRLVTLLGLAGTALGAATGAVAVAGQLDGSTAVVTLWVAQAVAGVGAGAVMSATLALLAAGAPDPGRRARWIALWAAATVGGLGGGPFLTGAVTAVAGWWWLYPPIALLAVAAAALGFGVDESPAVGSGVAESQGPWRRPVDVAGHVAAAGARPALGSGFAKSRAAGSGVAGSQARERRAVDSTGQATTALGPDPTESPAHERRPIDVAGQAAVAVGVAALVFAVIDAGTAGWASPATLIPLAVAVVAFAALAVVERRAEAPLLPLSLFASRGFAAAALASTVMLFAIGGGLFFLSLTLSRQHVGQLGIALRLGCLFAGNALGSVVAGRLQRRLDGRTVLLAGLVVAAAGAGSLLTAAGAGAVELGWRLAVLGLGAGLVMAASSAVAVQSVPGGLAGLAGAASNAFRQVGAALGPAVLGGVLAARATAGVAGAVHAFAAVLTVALAATAVIATALIHLRTGRTAARRAPTPARRTAT